ncbi:siderochrome-iron transporter [Xylariaceae sp. FL0804]|nr:siderochrome-iron transporter [Xylariaceae sp. FL0804]
MGFASRMAQPWRSSSSPAATTDVQLADSPSENAKGTGEKEPTVAMEAKDIETGPSRIEATQAVWGKKGFRLVVLGLAMMMILFELDNSTVYVYNNYSTSAFGHLSALGSLSTATTIIFAVVKPPIAKISDVLGRGQTFIFTITCYLVAYMLMASAKSIGPYAAGLVFYNVGQSGTNVMTNVIVSDITSPRVRGFALAISYFPFLITPWVSALVVGSVVAPDGIGWRWGIGMFAILMPFGSSFIIGTLLYYQGKAKKLGVLKPVKMSFRDFCSAIDLGGLFFFVAGFACLLLPLTIAAQLEGGWSTPWIIALIAVGLLLLACLPLYELRVARHPVLPFFYLRDATIVVSCLLIATDSVGFSATHTYLYAWSSVSHDLGAEVATFLTYVNGVMQTFVGIFAGWYMLRTGRYKWLVMGGAVARLVGYGVMIRLRGPGCTLGELFGQQVIQGVGSGIIQTCLLVPPQVVVPRRQIAQVLALVFSLSFLGSSVGSTIAGAIYTNTMREALRHHLGDSGSAELVDQLYNSITGTLPAWGSAEREAINLAYSQVITYITYAAIGASIPSIVLCFFLPNLKLPR